MKGNRGGADVWLTWESGQGWSGGGVEELFRRYGIVTTGRQLARQPGDHYGIRVPASQAVWAEYILVRAGVALSSPLLNPRHARIKPQAERTLPPAWGKPVSPLRNGVMGIVVWLLTTMFGASRPTLRQRSSKGRKQYRGKRR